MRWRADLGRPAFTMAALALLALGACSAPPSQTPPPSSAAAGTTVATSGGDAAGGTGGGDTPDGNGAGNGSGKNDGGGLAWVPPGPVDPADPTQNQWYLLLQAKDCDGLVDAVNAGNAATTDGFALWSTATAACQAVYQHQETRWSEAAAGLASLQRPGQDRCLDRAAYDLVAALVAFHADNPSTAPSPGPGSGTACPLQLTGMANVLDGGAPTDTPSSGLAGGRFQLAGRFLDVAAVMVGDQRVPAEPDPDQNGRWVVDIPAASAAGTVQVTAEASSGALPGTLTFTYLDDAATAPVSPTPGESAPADPAQPAPAEPTQSAPADGGG